MRHSIKNLVIPLLVAISFNESIAQTPLNWTRDEINPGEDFMLVPDGSKFTEGIKSCQIQLNSGAVPYLVSDVFYITPGAAYEFSCDVFDNDTAGQVKVYADFYDTYGFDIFGQSPVFSGDSPEWQTINWTGTVPTQAVVGYVLVKFYNQPDLYNFTKTSHTWIDNFRFTVNGGDNLVSNGGFEEWIVGINDPSNERNHLSVYPNPADDYVDIDLPLNSRVIIISDLAGKELLNINTNTNNHLRVDISDYPGGLYITTIVLESGPVIKGKIIKH
jgi:hypothetical protein